MTLLNSCITMISDVLPNQPKVEPRHPIGVCVLVPRSQAPKY